MFEKEKESLLKKGVNSEVKKIDALFIYDGEGYVTGIKYPDESSYLGKDIKKYGEG
ncbi:hypothetical protein AAGG74_17185 [Bacillus mexicanus]|uniref:hypothetical protein n=1 Tax=Bacillus mexicanus TaxID=2834415 RepID=UPI003D214AF9